MDKLLRSLLEKYDIPVPRYTSYPTVPAWDFSSLSLEKWQQSVRERFWQDKRQMSLYIHLPFCEELCTYCACNKRITKNHSVEIPYIKSLLKEWRLYLSLFQESPIINEIHLGGGTPTFFSADSLELLLSEILESSDTPEKPEFSIEVHPNYTTKEQLKRLQKLGFSRISLGVQDFDPHVQFLINRIQSFESTKRVVEWARDLNYESINLDLIYGLPKQNLQSINYTFDYVKELNPERIAFYSYAHVPWKSKGQRRYSEADIPRAEDKYQLFLAGRQKLLASSYESIGMDHFAKSNDSLTIAYQQKNCHRNFMGYTTTSNKLLIGLGASSISDTWNAFAQNEKEVEKYQSQVDNGVWALNNGHSLTMKDLQQRQFILDIMCRGEIVIEDSFLSDKENSNLWQKMKIFNDDQLLIIEDKTIRLTELGKIFIRNIASAFDSYYTECHTEPRFSQSI